MFMCLVSVVYYSVVVLFFFFFFFKQKTAYEMRISDWSSDVCSSDLRYCRYGRYGLAGYGDEKWRIGTTPIWRLPVSGPARTQWTRSEERRVGKECVSTCRSRWSPYH